MTQVQLHPSWENLWNKPTDLVHDADLAAYATVVAVSAGLATKLSILDAAAIATSGSANDLVSGTIGNARLSAQVARTDLGNTFALVQAFASGFNVVNGTNGTESSLYGTYTDTSNYRRLRLGMSSSGVGFIRSEGLGSGAGSNTFNVYSTGAINLYPNNGLAWAFGTSQTAVYQTVIPGTDGALSLGGASNRWSTVYANTLDVQRANTGTLIQMTSATSLRTDSSQVYFYNTGTASSHLSFNRNGNAMVLGSGIQYAWSSGTDATTGTVATALQQASAGTAAVTTGTLGSRGNFECQNLTLRSLTNQTIIFAWTTIDRSGQATLNGNLFQLNGSRPAFQTYASTTDGAVADFGAYSTNGSTTYFELRKGASPGVMRVTQSTNTYASVECAGLSLVGAFNLAPITKAVLLASTANATTGGRWRVSDDGNKEAYPDGTNWRWAHDNSVIT